MTTQARGIRTPVELGAVLRGSRLRRGWTQADLAARAGVSRAFVIDIERGRRERAELGRVLALVRALGLAIHLGEFAAPDPDEALWRLIDGQEAARASSGASLARVKEA